MVKPLTEIASSPAVTPSESIKQNGQSLQNPLHSNTNQQTVAVEPTNSRLTQQATHFDAPLVDFDAELLLASNLLEPTQWRKVSQQLKRQLVSVIKASQTPATETTANHPSQRVLSEAYKVLDELDRLYREYKVNHSLLVKP